MMKPSNQIMERLRAGKLVSTMYLSSIASPRLIEMVGAFANFHGLWIDQEHSGRPHDQLDLLLVACRAAGLDAFARIAATDYTAVMRPLEAGCSGIMIAQVRTVDEVKQAVQWAKYPPVGMRGMFVATPEANFGQIELATHIANANRDRWVAIQIETVEALEVVDQIAAVEGVDWLFIGPVDLSVALGVPGEFLHPRSTDALARVASAVRKQGKSWGILSRDPDHARKCRELGCQLFSLAGDVDCLRIGLHEIERRFAELFPK